MGSICQPLIRLANNVLLSLIQGTRATVKKLNEINKLPLGFEHHVLRSLDFGIGVLVVQDEFDVFELIENGIPYGTPDVQQAIVIGLAPVRVENNVSV